MTNLNVNLNNIDDMKKALSTIHNRLRQLDPNRLSKKEKANKEFTIMLNILNKIIMLPPTKNKEANFYVYCHYINSSFSKKDSRHLLALHLGLKGLPIYIGKGCNNRAYNTSRNSIYNLEKSKLKDGSINIQIIDDNLHETAALILEGKLIDLFGTRALKTGSLTNIDEGYLYKKRRSMYKSEIKQLVDMGRKSWNRLL